MGAHKRKGEARASQAQPTGVFLGNCVINKPLWQNLKRDMPTSMPSFETWVEFLLTIGYQAYKKQVEADERKSRLVLTPEELIKP